MLRDRPLWHRVPEAQRTPVMASLCWLGIPGVRLKNVPFSLRVGSAAGSRPVGHRCPEQLPSYSKKQRWWHDQIPITENQRSFFFVRKSMWTSTIPTTGAFPVRNTKGEKARRWYQEQSHQFRWWPWWRWWYVIVSSHKWPWSGLRHSLILTSIAKLPLRAKTENHRRPNLEGVCIRLDRMRHQITKAEGHLHRP